MIFNDIRNNIFSDLASPEYRLSASFDKNTSIIQKSRKPVKYPRTQQTSKPVSPKPGNTCAIIKEKSTNPQKVSTQLNYSIDSILCNSIKPCSATPQQADESNDKIDTNFIFDQLRDSGYMNPNLQAKITSDNKVKLEPIGEQVNTSKNNVRNRLDSVAHGQSKILETVTSTAENSSGTTIERVKLKGAKKFDGKPQRIGKNLPNISGDKVKIEQAQNPGRTPSVNR